MPRKRPAKAPPAGSATRVSPYDMIQRAIRTGEFTPNQVLPEETLAEWCGVSRTPVREALTRLQNDGLITRTPRGPMVRARSIEEILNIYEVRIELETKAARLAAERGTDHTAILLRIILDRQERAAIDSVPDRVSGARNFHEEIWRASRNDTLFEVLARLDMLVPRNRRGLANADQHERNLAHHRSILAAIEAHDPDAAADAARVHAEEARDIHLRNWSETTDEVGIASAGG